MPCIWTTFQISLFVRQSLRPFSQGSAGGGFSLARKNKMMKIWLFDSKNIGTAMLSQTTSHIFFTTVAVSGLPRGGFKTGLTQVFL